MDHADLERGRRFAGGACAVVARGAAAAVVLLEQVTAGAGVFCQLHSFLLVSWRIIMNAVRLRSLALLPVFLVACSHGHVIPHDSPDAAAAHFAARRRTGDVHWLWSAARP